MRTPSLPSRLRIGIDCRLAGARHAGIGRYIENLITRLPERVQNTSVHYLLFFHDQAQCQAIFPNVPSHVEIIYCPVRHYTIAEQLVLPFTFASAQLDVLHVPHFNVPIFYQGRTVVTIHDLLWHEYQGTAVTTLPSWQYWIKHWLYRIVASRAIQRSVRIFTPAQTVAKTIVQYYPHSKGKIDVTYEGIGDAFHSSAKPSQVKFPKRLVYVGSLYPHKNVGLIFAALRHCPEYTLSIVGTRTVFQDHQRAAAQQCGVADRVSFVGYLSDQELVTFLQESAALIQPSLSEGFGLTGVEAMAAGVPVLASDIPIFHEIYQDAAMFFDPHSANALAECIHTLEKADQTSLRRRAHQVIKRYDWHTMVEHTIQGYIHALTHQ